MPTGVQPSSADDLAAFAAQLDGLRSDQNPENLSNALRVSFRRCELYNVYSSSLVEDAERARALMTFDKVCSVTRFFFFFLKSVYIPVSTTSTS